MILVKILINLKDIDSHILTQVHSQVNKLFCYIIKPI